MIETTKKLDLKRLGLTGGIIWGLMWSLITLISIPTDYEAAGLNARAKEMMVI